MSAGLVRTGVAGLAAVVAVSAFGLVPASASEAAFVSDDFSAGGLDTSLWTVTDPAGEGSVTVTDDQLHLTVPDSTDYDIWNTNRALRATQPVTDTDFEAEARFLSVPTQKYQTQGILVEQDDDNWLRFDVHSTGSKLRIFAAATTNGSSSALLQQTITAGTETQLRLTRTGNDWTLAYSTDGTTWTTAGTVTHTLNATHIGPFASNGSPYPAFTASLDWFIDTANPDPQPEPEPEYTLTTEVTGQGIVTVSPDQASYTEGTVVTLTVEPADGWTFTDWTGDATATTTSIDVTMDADKTITATFTEENTGVPPQIDVWYGPEQTFGHHGQPQRWVNVLGNVSHDEGVDSLSYRLNDGPSHALSIGSDLRRLYGDGDFNVEIPFTELASGANSVTITATGVDGGVATETVAVHNDMQQATLPHTVTWNGAASVNDVAQAVDGTWSTGADGVSVVDMGYDRTIAVGDIAWSDYEITVPVTVRGTGPGAGTPQSGSALVGLGLHWDGHTTQDAEQPAQGWYPTGAFAWHRWYNDGRFELIGNDGSPLDRQSQVWNFGTTYVMKARAETVADGVEYSYKWWPQGSTEPADWNLTLVEDSGPAEGSVLLIAHHVDATFGDVTISPL